MKMMSTLLGTCAMFVALYALVAIAQPPSDTTYAAEQPASMAATHADAHVALAQASDDDNGDDTRVWVQSYTILAAGGAMAIGLLLFLVRVALGRVRMPPPQDDGSAAHH